MSTRFELILILRETLRQLEQESDPNDPAVEKLKRTLLLAIGDLEAGKSDNKGAVA